jgi:hypothetical protein
LPPAPGPAPVAAREVGPPVANRAVEAAPAAQYEPEPEQSPWFNVPQQVEYHGDYDPAYDPEQYAQWYAEQQQAEQYQQEQFQQEQVQRQFPEQPVFEEPSAEETGSFPIPVSPGRTRELGEGGGPPEPDEDAYYQVFRESIKSGNGAPTPRGFIADVEATYSVTLPQREAEQMVNRFSNRLNAELADEHIA